MIIWFSIKIQVAFFYNQYKNQVGPLQNDTGNHKNQWSSESVHEIYFPNGCFCFNVLNELV